MGSIRRYFKISRVTRNLLFVVLVLLIFDVLVAGLGTPYLRERISFLSRKSEKIVLCDLLFLEGAIIFSLGSFVAYATLGKRYGGDKSRTDSTTTADDKLSQKRIPFWILIMIIGVSFMGLSIAIGTLLP